MGSSRVEQALNELDPGSRAVVDLSLGTDFSDENIATLIRVEPDEVARRRDRAIDALQQKLGGASHDDVVMQLCAAMGVEPSPAMLEGEVRNGSAHATPVNGVAAAAAEPEVAEPEPEPPRPNLEPATDEPEPEEPVESGPDPSRGSGEPVATEPASAEEASAETGSPELQPPLDAETDASEETVTETEPETETETASPAEPELPAEPVAQTDTANGSQSARIPAPGIESRSDPDTRDRTADAPSPPAPPAGGRDETGASGSRRRVGVLVAALVAGALFIGGIVALSSGGGGSGSESADPQTPSTEQSSDPAAVEEIQASATLDALPDAPSGGEAEVSLDGDQLTIELGGLPAPEGTYEAWLFTSVLDSRPLGSTDDGSGTIRAELPDSADRFEYLDVSIQPSSDAQQHSGQSIFRVPVADLLG